MKKSLIALAALAAASAGNAFASAVVMNRNGNVPSPRATRPERISNGLPGMGTKVRGNRAVMRASAKARNVKRHKANCRRAAA